MAGTFYVAYDDDGAGTNEVALSPTFDIAANGGGAYYRFRLPAAGCLATASAKQLTIVSATAILAISAIVSKAAS